MKIVSALILLLICSISLADTTTLQHLLAERSKQAIIYKQINDSAGLSNYVKTVLLKNQLLKVATIDDGILQHALPVLKDAQAKSDSLQKVQSKLSSLANERDRLQERTKNDMNMLLILKATVAVLLVVILALLYFLIFKRKNHKVEVEQQNATLLNLEREKDELEKELSKYKIIELNLKQEIDKSYRSIEENNYVWSEKCRQLENELLTATSNNQPIAESSITKDISEYELLIEHFKIEHEQLTKQVETLKAELQEANSKNTAIMKKIVKLINDLSTVNS